MSNLLSIDEGFTLGGSPALARLIRHLRDLITIGYETSTNIPSNSLSLTRLQYVSDEKLDGKLSMHFVALVRAPEQSEGATLNLTFTVEV